jgi:hypothetical protein
MAQLTTYRQHKLYSVCCHKPTTIIPVLSTLGRLGTNISSPRIKEVIAGLLTALQGFQGSWGRRPPPQERLLLLVKAVLGGWGLATLQLSSTSSSVSPVNQELRTIASSQSPQSHSSSSEQFPGPGICAMRGWFDHII